MYKAPKCNESVGVDHWQKSGQSGRNVSLEVAGDLRICKYCTGPRSYGTLGHSMSLLLLHLLLLLLLLCAGLILQFSSSVCQLSGTE